MKFTNKKILAAVLALALPLTLAGCGAAAQQTDSGAAAPAAQTAAVSAAALASSVPAAVESVTDPEQADAQAQGAFSVTASEGGAVTQSGSVWTITAAGEYTLTGALEDGQIVVDAGDSDVVVLILDNAAIACSTGAPICVLNADDVTVKAAEGSYNTVADLRAGDAENEEHDAAIWSDCDLKLRGKGTLIVTSAYAKGVKTTDDLSVKNLTLKVDSADTALRGKDSVTVESGTLLLLSAQGDGINSDADILISDGAVSITVGDDGVHADGALTIAGGTVRVEDSHEGLEANIVNIDGGSTYVYGRDDGVNARSGDAVPLVSITGGYLEVATPSGDTDAIDSNGSFAMSGGFVLVRSGAGMGGMTGSVDTDGGVTVTGGTIIALGGVCAVPGSGSVNTWVSGNTALGAGDYTLTDEKGSELASFTLPGSYAGVWIASDAIELGGTYTLSRDGSAVASWTQSSQTEGSAPFGGMGSFGGKGGGFGAPPTGESGGQQGGFGGQQSGFGGQQSGGQFPGRGGMRAGTGTDGQQPPQMPIDGQQPPQMPTDGQQPPQMPTDGQQPPQMPAFDTTQSA